MNTAYPLHLEGSLDPPLSRWQPLVKWLLAIPHAVVLTFLWIANVVLSVVALFAIVATGRYPRAIFDFNVGVLRWTWRVGFYSYSALVQWWLLALPHFVIVAALASVRSVLVLVAGASLLFTGRYPQQLFDLIMGIERWIYRVAAYASLMTNDYPPFRLDVEEDGSPRATAIAVS